MSPQLRRVAITIGVLSLAAGVVLISVVGPGKARPAAPGTPAPAATSSGPPATAGAPTEASPGEAAPPEARAAPPPAAPAQPIAGLHARWHQLAAPPQALGSPDPRRALLHLELSAAGAGLSKITLSNLWLTAADGREARAHYEALDRADPNPPPLPPDDRRYVLQTARPLPAFDAATGQWTSVEVPQLAADTITINGSDVRLLTTYTDASGAQWALWRETAPGAFEATILDGDDREVARVTRQWVVGTGYDVTLQQRVVNLTGEPLQVKWLQYGPGDLIADRSRYIDMRRFRFGYLPDAATLPDLVASGDNDLLVSRRDALKRVKRAKEADEKGDAARARELRDLWPSKTSRDKGYSLSWFASTNRYFAMAVHPVLDVAGPDAVTGDRSIEPILSRVGLSAPDPDSPTANVFTGLYSPPRTIAPGQETAFDVGVYAGPLSRAVLARQQPMRSLHMVGLILYQMSSMCALCTFQWLALGLLEFLSGVHLVVADWGVAIILLVLVVRTLLHPLTKRAQINMQRFGKVMGDLKPEIDKLQKKYPNDARKLQQEQMKMMRERGVNPMQVLGCLPMFLQMPIWIALYAMLYFAFELRHEPAFWGVFQLFGGWPFLSDLSSADHCFWEFAQPFRFLWLNVTGINLLPVLMGVVFFVQQKYMTPPPSASMTPEQAQQQKIMKVLMVVMFPVMLYSAPSGLTLYIFTSSLFGILESRYIRAHIKAMDLMPPKAATPKKKPRDLQGRLYADALERARKKRKPPPKRFKKRS